MSFLDNLENNLKAMESREPSGLDDSIRRDRDRQHAIATGPWAEQLKKGPYAPAIMQLATRAGYKIRTKVNLLWMDSTLRLEARGHKLELRPTSDGVIAVFVSGRDDVHTEPVDLQGTPNLLVDRWMTMLEEQKKIDEISHASEVPD